MQVDSAARFEQVVQALANRAELFQSQQTLGSTVGVLDAPGSVDGQQTLQGGAQKPWVVLQRQDLAIAERGEQAIFHGHRRMAQLFQYRPSLTVTDTGDVQRTDDFALQAADRHADTKEMLEITEVMLVADQHHRHPFGQGATGRGGPDVGFLDSPADLQRQQRACQRTRLTGVDNNALRVDAEHRP
ncbi:hypothetical protein D3C77_310250 [compost metagenome]